MNWARTLRIDEAPADAVRSRIAAAFRDAGVRVEVDGSAALRRTYALLQGPSELDPAQFEVRLPGAQRFGEAIIALAIEPAPADALPALQEALGGAGAPAGVASCDVLENCVVVELRPGVTHPALLLLTADVELRRFNASRRTRLISPLPPSTAMAVAARGLQAAEIAPDRILEMLLERADVE